MSYAERLTNRNNAVDEIFYDAILPHWGRIH